MTKKKLLSEIKYALSNILYSDKEEYEVKKAFKKLKKDLEELRLLKKEKRMSDFKIKSQELTIKTLERYLEYETDSNEELKAEIVKFKEMADCFEWLLNHLYIAGSLLELKIAGNENKIFDGWSHNGIQIIDKDFHKYKDFIVKYLKEKENERNHFIHGVMD